MVHAAAAGGSVGLSETGFNEGRGTFVSASVSDPVEIKGEYWDQVHE